MIAPTPPSARFRAAAQPGGFTLVEMVVTVAVMSVIMLGIGSAMIIAGHAVPDAGNPAAAGIAAAQVADQITTELQYATAINSYTANVIEFRVADRDGNDVPETIRYEWSGTPGDPLTRQYNSAAPVTMLDDVYEFNLAYDLTTTTTETPQGNESAETLLTSYHSDYYQDGRDVKSDRWRGQYFLPSLPADAVSWKVTRVRFYAAVKGYATGQCKVRLQLPTAGEVPSAVVLEEKTLLESTLNPYYFTLQEFDFSNVTGLSPAQGLCLVLKWISGNEACQILIRESGVPAASAGFMRSDNQGVAWTEYSDQSLLFWVYGTVTTEGEPQIESSYYLDRVDIKLQQSDAAQSIVQTGVKVLNRPEVVQ